MFEGLLGFVAQLSMVLWSVVILTAIIRFIGIRIYRNGAARAEPAPIMAPTSDIPSTVAAPAAVVLVSSDIPRAEPRSREQVSAHVLNSAHAVSSVEL